MKNKKTIIILIILIIFIVILGFLSYVFFYNLKNPVSLVDKNMFSDELDSMGKTIYQDYYYEITAVDKSEEELTNYLKKFTVIGLQFNLVELSKYNDEFNEKIDIFLRNNKLCSKEKTMVIIYPKEPYSKSDFTTEVKLDCNEKE